MTIDIVKRLRQEIAGYTDGPIEAAETTMREAADEIELLRKQLAHSVDLGNNWLDEIERLRGVLQQIANIENEDIPAPQTSNEGVTWTVLAMTVGLAEKALERNA